MTSHQDPQVAQLIAKLDLQPHPEGGWYKETYRSSDTIGAAGLPDRFGGESAKSAATGIYFLLTCENFSAFHKIKSDEGWHFYAGPGGLRVYDISPTTGEMTVHRLGPGEDEVFQSWVPANHWFGSRVEGKGNWALVGCTVSPGFEFADFEMAKRKDLLAAFPQHQQIIQELTRE